MQRTVHWEPSKLILDNVYPYCPGCQDLVIIRTLCEVMEELGIEDRAIAVCGVGCCSFPVPLFVDIDAINTAHGRAPDAATGIKRLHPESVVFTLQGDGDCISIGAGSLINAAHRAERITVIMVSNTNFGTTGGQMSPTTLLGQRTTSTPGGRDPGTGYPAHVPELLASIRGVAYTARGAVNTPKQIRATKRYLGDAFKVQMDNVGLGFVEVLSACPTDWRMSPLECLDHIEGKIIPEFPLGVFKSVEELE